MQSILDSRVVILLQLQHTLPTPSVSELYQPVCASLEYCLFSILCIESSLIAGMLAGGE